jgi:hypothetical protein
MANALQSTNSPYLLQHAENPVDWLPWSEAALQRARDQDQPIFLSIGYAACHWCHVMAHESFEDPRTAELMNEHFINIKVDREERPDLDHIYMQAVVALTGQGGWPMSVFLTPEGKPFYGGTYFPPIPRGGMPSFRQVLSTIGDAWDNDRQSLLESADRVTDHLASLREKPPLEDYFELEDLNTAVERLEEGYDWQFGGWGPAPKFPQAMAVTFLLTQASRGSQRAEEIALDALDAMAKGGMYDVIGGGFARYSVDKFWLVPHFEKMLYDNALLARSYLYAAVLTGQQDYRRILEQTLAFVTRELTDPEGGFYSSLDADSEGEEGKYYTWTEGELAQALADHPHRDMFYEAYQITPEGNFEGKMVLQQGPSDQQLALTYNLSEGEIRKTLEEIHGDLFEIRTQRVRPAVDDKVLTGWNGLMLTTFAEAARYLGEEAYLNIAIRNAKFLIEGLRREDGRLLRSWRQGQAQQPGYLEDYAALIQGLLALYQADPDPAWFQTARELTDQMLELFYQPGEGFYDTGPEDDTLPFRPRSQQDNAVPSGPSLAVQALLSLAALTMEFDWQEIAEDTLAQHKETILRYPTGFGTWLQAADFSVGPTTEIALLGEQDHPLMQEYLQAVSETYRPRTVLARAAGPGGEELPELLEDRTLLEGKPTAYLCRSFVCLQPTDQLAEFQRQLEAE